MRLPDVETVARGALSELPFEEALGFARSMGLHSFLSFEGKLSYPGYRHVPVSWIYCEDDKMIVPTLQQQYIDRIEAESGAAVNVHTLATGHMPNLTATDQLARMLVQIITG
jgi:pimeloyl-ACP methyl ester carboxylesterase